MGNDLLAIVLLYSLPNSYDNFRCAIESRDELPTPENLRIKILVESDAESHGRGALGVWNKQDALRCLPTILRGVLRTVNSRGVLRTQTGHQF